MGKQKAHKKAAARAAEQAKATETPAATGNGGAQITMALGANVPDAFIADLAEQWGLTVAAVRAKPALMAEVVKAHKRHQDEAKDEKAAAEQEDDERIDERALTLLRVDGERVKNGKPRNERIRANCPLIPSAVYELRIKPFWDLVAFAIVLRLALREIAETFGWRPGEGTPKSHDQELAEQPLWLIRNQLAECLNGAFRFNIKMLDGLAGKVKIDTFERVGWALRQARLAGNREAILIMGVVGQRLSQFIDDLYQAEEDAIEAARHQREVAKVAAQRASEAAKAKAAYDELHAPVADDQAVVVRANAALAFLAEISSDPSSLLDGNDA